jgi:hypothetical protein
MKREYVDFSFIPEHQLGMHWRLVNWERSLRGSAGSGVSPMFRQYRSSEVYSQGGGKMPLDHEDANAVGRAVVALPTPMLLAINWWYVKPVAPSRAAKGMQCSLAELARYVIDGRALLMERGA